MTRIFDCPDCDIEVKSDKAIRWYSDSCDCVLVFEVDTLELDFAIQVCQIHKTVADVDLVSTVLLHNNTLNQKLGTGTELTKAQSNELIRDRTTEKRRIISLGSPEVRADETTKDAIEADLRRKGR